MLNKFLDVNPEVAKAVAEGKPVVALESTIISHGMPYPQNVETALKVEQIIRDNGAVPATIAIIGGRLKAGLTKEEIEYFGKKGQAITKASRRDLAVICSEGQDGATTVTTTMIIAHMAGIKFFATGGIGGVHRGAQQTFDISADLQELAHTPVMVCCAGAKAILDLALTLEYLETQGVPVLGYQTKELPAFYSRHSGLEVDYQMNTPEECAKVYKSSEDLGFHSGILLTNPIPEEFAMDDTIINNAIDEAIKEMDEKGIKGKACTPFLLAKVAALTGGDSLDSNIHLVFNNAQLMAKVACEYSKMQFYDLEKSRFFFLSVLFYDMYMIQLTDYLYNGDTLIRILHKYSAALEMEAKKTNNIVDLSHVSFLKEYTSLLEHNDFLTSQSQRIREFYKIMAADYPFLAFTFRGRIKSLIRAEEKFNGYIVRYIYEYIQKNNTYPTAEQIVDAVSYYRDLIAYRIVICMPKCHLHSTDNKEEIELNYLYEIANRLPSFIK